MSDIICRNCHSVTAPLQNCLVCNTPLGNLPEKCFGNLPAPSSGYLAKAWRSLAGLVALAWSALRCFLTSSRRGKPMSVPMDPHLYRHFWRIQELGIRKPETSSTGEGEIAVIAKICGRNFEEFKQRVEAQGGRITTTITGDADDSTVIVTAR